MTAVLKACEDSRKQDRQAKRPLDVEIQSADLLERAIEHGTAARFQRHDEGQSGMRIAGPLQQRVDADSELGEYRGHFGHDSRPVFDHETNVMWNHEIAAHGIRIFRKLARVRGSGIRLPRDA